jgi:hypothetical protein
VNESERYTEICKPQFEEINKNLALLTKHLVIGNGKPSILNRVDALEKCAEKRSEQPKDNRSLAIGKLIVLKGYGSNDVIRIVIVVGVLWLVFEPYLRKLIK